MSTSKSRHKHPWVAKHIADLPKSGIRDFFDIVSTMKEVISLGIGEPDFVTPWNIREATIYALNKGNTAYTSNLGDLKLRKAIAAHAEEAFQASYNPETEIIVTIGVSEALDILMRAVLEPGDEVLYHEPTVTAARAIQESGEVTVSALSSCSGDEIFSSADLRYNSAMIQGS